MEAPTAPLDIQLTVPTGTGSGAAGFDLYSANNLSVPLSQDATQATLGPPIPRTYYINVYAPGGQTSPYTLTLSSHAVGP